MPSTSHYVVAQQNDPEVVAWVLAQQELSAGRWRPRPADFGTPELLLAGIHDRLGQALNLLGDLPTPVKRRSRPPDPFPRPRTGLDEARARMEALIEDELDDLINAAHKQWLTEQQQAGGEHDGVPVQ